MRFRLPSAGSPAVNPAFEAYTHANGVRRPLLLVDSSALTTVAQTPDAADHLVAGDTSHFQGTSDPLAAQTIAAQTVKLAIQCLEANANNNLFIQLVLKIVSNDGTTTLGTLLAKTLDNTELGTSIINRFLSVTTTAFTITAGNAGARLVAEISVSGTPTATGGVQGHNASLRFGSDGAGGDLGENDTDTGATLNPWLDFANALQFPVNQVDMAGQASGAGSATGNIVDVVPLAGNIAGVGTPSGSITNRIPMSGTVAGVGLATGNLVDLVSVAGVSLGMATVIGDIGNIIVISGTAGGVGQLTGVLVRPVELGGTASGIGILDGQLVRLVELSGMVLGVGLVTGAFEDDSLLGVIQGVGTAFGTLISLRSIEGVTAGMAEVSGIIQAIAGVEGISVGVGQAIGDLEKISGLYIPPCPTGVILGESKNEVLLKGQRCDCVIGNSRTGAVIICLTEAEEEELANG